MGRRDRKKKFKKKNNGICLEKKNHHINFGRYRDLRVRKEIFLFFFFLFLPPIFARFFRRQAPFALKRESALIPGLTFRVIQLQLQLLIYFLFLFSIANRINWSLINMGISFEYSVK